MVASITSISPESVTADQLWEGGRQAGVALNPGWYWLNEGIDVEDEVAKQFPPYFAAAVDRGPGRVVNWRYGEIEKPERIIDPHEAITFYRSLGFLMVAGRLNVFKDRVFKDSEFGQGRELIRRFGQFIVQKPPEREMPPPSSFTPVEGHITPGFTNEVHLVADEAGRRYVQKTIRSGPEGIDGLIQRLTTEEFVEIGFMRPDDPTSDILVFARTGPEQQALCEQFNRLGIPTAVPVYADAEKLIMPQVAGQTLWEHLQEGKTSAIATTLQSLYRAHTNETYGGEPWGGNFMVVTEDGKNVVRLDFEVAIEGRHAAELEMAQLLYATLSLTTNFDEALAKVASFVNEHTEDYDWPQVRTYIRNYERYFVEHPNLPSGEPMERAKHRLGARLEAQIAPILA